MKRVIASLLLAAALVLPSTSALAASCPDGYHLHTVGDGDHEHGEHRHLGLSPDAVDQNENGQICVRHLNPRSGLHVHIDDSIP